MDTLKKIIQKIHVSIIGYCPITKGVMRIESMVSKMAS